ncbi:MAG: EAL domain-containing protein [Arcobacteraceae bacterium]
MSFENRVLSTLQNENFHKILKNYQFSSLDAKALKEVEPIIQDFAKPFLKGFYEFILAFDHAKLFLHNKEILQRHELGIHQWYLNLFCGNYNDEYFDKLHFISEIHVRIGLPTHYVNAAFSYARGFIKDILIQENLILQLSSFDKIIDINLDILTIAYQEEEQTKFVDEVVFLKNCVDKCYIEPYFQAIYNAKTLKVEKYESLMRLFESKDSPARSVFPYLRTAKKIKHYEKMMRIMVEKTFEYIEKSPYEFSINLSYEDISNEKFIDFIYEKTKAISCPNCIIFEILESDFIEDFSIVEKFAKTIRSLGCKIAIDDFGSGYSNMENILKLRPEIIKIDGSLIKNIDTSAESKTIVKNIINMAKELNAITVAEFVHTKEVCDCVIELQVDYLQGFYLQEPEPFS